MNDVNYLCG